MHGECMTSGGAPDAARAATPTESAEVERQRLDSTLGDGAVDGILRRVLLHGHTGPQQAATAPAPAAAAAAPRTPGVHHADERRHNAAMQLAASLLLRRHSPAKDQPAGGVRGGNLTTPTAGPHDERQDGAIGGCGLQRQTPAAAESARASHDGARLTGETRREAAQQMRAALGTDKETGVVSDAHRTGGGTSSTSNPANSRATCARVDVSGGQHLTHAGTASFLRDVDLNTEAPAKGDVSRMAEMLLADPTKQPFCELGVPSTRNRNDALNHLRRSQAA